MPNINFLVLLFTAATSTTCQSMAPFAPDYRTALKLSLLFYEAQRSGRLPESNRVSWRRDSALDDKGLHGEDLSGGYYDASDFVKFSFTMAFTTTILAWGMLSFDDAYAETGTFSQFSTPTRPVSSPHTQ
jgi:hypothetical protein